jgi:hypothetical protein
MKVLSKLVVVASLVAAPALAMACGMDKEKTAETPPAKPAVAQAEKGAKPQAKVVPAKAARPQPKPATAQD